MSWQHRLGYQECAVARAGCRARATAVIERPMSSRADIRGRSQAACVFARANDRRRRPEDERSPGRIGGRGFDEVLLRGARQPFPEGFCVPCSVGGGCDGSKGGQGNQRRCNGLHERAPKLEVNNSIAGLRRPIGSSAPSPTCPHTFGGERGRQSMSTYAARPRAPLAKANAAEVLAPKITKHPAKPRGAQWRTAVSSLLGRFRVRN